MMNLLVQGLVAFIGVGAFSILFDTPRKYHAACGLTGALGWVTYLAVVPYTSKSIASLCAALVITLLARVFAVRFRCPTTTFLVTGIFPIVPGAGIYFAAYYLIVNNEVLSVQTGVEAMKMAACIAIGIVLVLALPNGMFAWLAGPHDARTLPAKGVLKPDAAPQPAEQTKGENKNADS